MPPNEPAQVPPKNHQMHLRLDLRIIVFVLLLVIAIMSVVWRPWSSKSVSSNRTITVSGEAKITAEPDEFIFQPSYEFKNAKKDVALANLTKKSDAIVKKLKEIGVADNKIKTNSDNNQYYVYSYDSTSGQNNYTLRFTVTVDDRKLAQKVQDYLITTSPSGQVSPQSNFSEAKRKELENTARDEATKDARAKADQLAKNLGFKVDKVKSIDDGTTFGGIGLLGAPMDVTNDKVQARSVSLGVQPGENELTYSITAVYYIR